MTTGSYMNQTKVRSPAYLFVIWHRPLLELLAISINNEHVAVFHRLSIWNKMGNTQGKTHSGIVEVLQGSAALENFELEHNTFPW